MRDFLPLPREPDWSSIEPVRIIGTASQPSSCAVHIPTSAGALRVSLTPHGARLQIGRCDQPVYPILVSEPAEIGLALHETEDAIVLAAGGFVLALTRSPLAFELAYRGRSVLRSATDGHFVRKHRLPPFARTTAGQWFCALDLPTGSPVYGLGEKWGKLDRRGEFIRSEVFDALGVNSDRAYKNTPFAWSPGAPGADAWGLFVNTPSNVFHAVGHALWSQRSYVVVVEDEGLDLFLFAGAAGADIIAAYTALTGRAEVPPYWSLGAILSRAYYRTADDILEAARQVRVRNMPCDTITFDGRAWQDTPTRFHFGFDETRYPNPGAVIGELKSLGFHICVWEYPLVAVGGLLFERMAEKNWLIRDRRNGKPYLYSFDAEPFGAVLTQLPVSGLVDFTHPEAYAFWRDAHEPLFELGVDMIKSDFGEQIEADCLAANGDTGARLHNVYPLLYNECVRDAVKRYGRGDAFQFVRAGWSGSQRHPVQWGGDPQSDWEGFAASVRGGLSWGLSGGPYHASDVGGFYKDGRNPELFVRWTQAAIFFSHLRFHGVGPREPWTYGAKAEAAAMAALELRYRLLPYLWDAVIDAGLTSMPVHRAMVLAFPNDRAAWAFEEQWMCGPDLLVAACPRPGGAIEVYLPEGNWTRFPQRGTVRGGRVLVMQLALDETAVFARQGAEIKLGPPIRHTGETGGAPVTSEIWRG